MFQGHLLLQALVHLLLSAKYTSTKTHHHCCGLSLWRVWLGAKWIQTQEAPKQTHCTFPYPDTALGVRGQSPAQLTWSHLFSLQPHKDKCSYTFLKGISLIHSTVEFHFKIRVRFSLWYAHTLLINVNRNMLLHQEKVMTATLPGGCSQWQDLITEQLSAFWRINFPHLLKILFLVYINPVQSLKYEVQISLCVRMNLLTVILSWSKLLSSIFRI